MWYCSSIDFGPVKSHIPIVCRYKTFHLGTIFPATQKHLLLCGGKVHCVLIEGLAPSSSPQWCKRPFQFAVGSHYETWLENLTLTASVSIAWLFWCGRWLPLPVPPSLGLFRPPQGVLLVPLAGMEQVNHLVVLASQYPGQKERGLLCPACLTAPSGPAFPVDGHVPQSFGAGPLPGTHGWRGRCPIVPGGVSVIAKFMDPLHKLTLLVKHLLRKEHKASVSALFCDEKSSHLRK